MYVHPNPDLQGKNQWGLKDGNGKPIIQGMIAAAHSYPDKQEGWYHYIWPTPEACFPDGKVVFANSFKPLQASPISLCRAITMIGWSGNLWWIWSIMLSKNRKEGVAAYQAFHDPKGPFMAKDGYIYILDQKCIQTVNGGFPSLEGKDLSELIDAEGKHFAKEYLDLVARTDSGWVDYMWPKPGESNASQNPPM